MPNSVSDGLKLPFAGPVLVSEGPNFAPKDPNQPLKVPHRPLMVPTPISVFGTQTDPYAWASPPLRTLRTVSVQVLEGPETCTECPYKFRRPQKCSLRTCLKQVKAYQTPYLWLKLRSKAAPKSMSRKSRYIGCNEVIRTSISYLLELSPAATAKAALCQVVRRVVKITTSIRQQSICRLTCILGKEIIRTRRPTS